MNSLRRISKCFRSINNLTLSPLTNRCISPPLNCQKSKCNINFLNENNQLLKYYCSKAASLESLDSSKIEKQTNMSWLHVPTDRRSVFCSILEPYLEFEQQFSDLEILAENLEKRGLEDLFSFEKLIQMKKEYNDYQEILSSRDNIQKKMKKIRSQLKSLSGDKNDEEISQMKTQSNLLKIQLKKHKISQYEESLIPSLLDLPNVLDKITPSDDDEIIYSFSEKPSFDFSPLTHVQLGESNDSIELSNVSPGAFYLKKDLAEIELALEDYFVDIFHTRGFIHHSNPDLHKGVSTEGCGYDIHNHNEVIRILYQREAMDTTHLFLLGGSSLPAFTAYFAKRIVGKPQKFLPQKLFATGRLYNPLECGEKSSGILNSMQSSAVSAFIASPGSENSQTVTDEMLSLLKSAYQNLGIHFRIVQRSARSLNKNESSALSIEMFTSTKTANNSRLSSNLTDDYIEVARISSIGDYISKRLLMLHTATSQNNSQSFNPDLDFLNITYVKVMDISKFIAVMIENNQNEESKYSLPKCLDKHLLH